VPLPTQHHIPSPYAYRNDFADDAALIAASVAALEAKVAQLGAEHVAAFFCEPIQGSGGVIVPPVGWLKAMREACRKLGILFVADEVITGFGRTGPLFACQAEGVEPDLMTVAKSLAGGFPLSGVVGKAEIMDAPAPGGLGGTYAGSPISCAAALAVLDVIERENLCLRASAIGALLKQRLNGLRGRHGLHCIGDVRGLGAMVALELVKYGDMHQPDPDLAKALVQRAAENGLVILSCGTRANVIRFLVPLTASDAVISEGLGIFERSLVEVAGATAEAKRA